jgi:hypothetical protein
MNAQDHQRARKLIVMHRVEGLSPDDGRWLDEHLTVCNACIAEAETLTGAIQMFRAKSATASSDLVRRTKLALHHRAAEIDARPHRAIPLVIATTLASVWIVLTTPYIWAAFGWIGGMLGVPRTVWEIGFLMWWFLPATGLAAIVGWKVTQRDLKWSEL